MKNRGKRFIVLLLSVLMVLSQMSFISFAADPVEGSPDDTKEVAVENNNENNNENDTVDGTENDTVNGTGTEDGTAAAGEEASGGGDVQVQPEENQTVEKPASKKGLMSARSVDSTGYLITINNTTDNRVTVYGKDRGEYGYWDVSAGASDFKIGLQTLDKLYANEAIELRDVNPNLGWSLEASDNPSYKYCIVFDDDALSSNLSFKVVSAAEYWKVTFNPNGGSGSMAKQLIAKGDWAYLNENEFTNEGFVFQGWSEDKDAEEATYADKADFEPSGDTTLYAVWSKYVHQHNWNVYQDGGAHIYIECKNAGCPYPPTITLTLSTKNKKYDGVSFEDYEVTSSLGEDEEFPEGFAIPDDSDYSTHRPEFYQKNGNEWEKIDGAPKNAGDYKVKVFLTYEGKVRGSAEAGFSIEPKPVTVKADDQTKAYGQPDPELTYTVTGLVKGEKAKNVFSGSLERAEGDSIGDHDITQGTLAANDNYEVVFTPAKLTITKAQAEVVEAPQAINRVYDKKDSALVTAGTASENCKIVYALGDGPFNYNAPPTASEEGTYTVRYKAVPKNTLKDYYTESEEVSVPVTITPENVVAPVAKDGLVYNGDDQELVTPGSTDVGGMYYKQNGSWVRDSIPTGKNAGDYEVKWAVFTDDITDADHLITSGVISVTIDPYQITAKDVVAPTARKLVYNGTGQAVLDPGSSELGTMMYSLDKDSGYGEDIPEGTAAGTGTVWYKVVAADSQNFLDYGPESVSVSIDQMPVTVEWGERTLTYNGQDQTPEAAVKGADGAAIDASKYEVEGAAKNANESVWHILDYSATVTLKDPNYVIKGTDSTYFFIQRKEVDLKWSTDPITYDAGVAQHPDAKVKQGKIEPGDKCAVSSDAYTVYQNGKKVDAAVNAGDYTVTVKADGLTNSNYKPSEATATKAFTIGKADLVTSVEIEGWTYGEEPKTPTITNNPEKSAVTFDYYRQVIVSDETVDEKVDGVPSEAGLYKVVATVAESANYNETQVDCLFSIESADTKVSVSIEGWTYGQKANTPDVSCSIAGVDPKLYYAGTANDGTEYEDWDNPPVKAGSYAVAAIVDESADYSGASAVAGFEIGKADRKINVAFADWTYGNTARKPKISGKDVDVEKGKVSYFYKPKTGGDEFEKITSLEETASIPAGNYILRAEMAETANYKSTAAETGFTVNKADLEVVVTPSEGLVYALDDDGKPVEWPLIDKVNGYDPYDPGLPDGVKVRYKTSLISGYSDKVPTASEAGTHKVWYKVDGGNNYNDIDPLSHILKEDFTVTIAKADFDKPSVEIRGWDYLKYNAKKNAPKIIEETIPSDYDGDVIWMYAEVDLIDGVEVIDEDSWSEEVPEKAGRYAVEAVLTGSDNYKATTSIPTLFSVSKARITDLSVSIEPWNYGDEPSEPVVEGNIEGGDVTFTYLKKISAEEYEVLTSAPADAGDYKVVADVDETDNYSGGRAEAAFSVGKADLSGTAVSVRGWVYGNYKASRNAPKLDCQVEVAEKDVSYMIAELGELEPASWPADEDYEPCEVDKLNELDAGRYAIKAVIADSDAGNYDGITTSPTAFRVYPAGADGEHDEFLPTAITGLVYEGEELALVEFDETEWQADWGEVFCAVTKNSFTPLLADFVNIKDGYPARTDAGTYYVWIRVKQDNHWSEYRKLKVEIGKAAIKPEVTIEDWTYEDKANTPVVEGNDGEGKVSFRYTGTTVEGKAYNSKSAPDNAGEYTVTATIAETDNYLGGTATCEFTVEKRKSTGPSTYPLAKKNLDYTGEEQSLLSIPAVSISGKVRYAVRPAGEDAPSKAEFFTQLPKAAEIGDYNVWYYVEYPETSNYSDSDILRAVSDTGAPTGSDERYKITISKQKLKDLSVSIEPWNYGETPNEPVITGNDGNGKVTVTYLKKINDELYIVLESAPTDAGDYKVIVDVGQTALYEPGRAEAAFTVGKADLKGTTVSITSWTYGKYEAGSNEPELNSTVDIDPDDVSYQIAELGELEPLWMLDDDDYSDCPLDKLAELGAHRYAIRARIAKSVNYDGIDTAAKAFRVYPAGSEDHDEYLPTAKTGLVYKGEELELVDFDSQSWDPQWGDVFYAVTENAITPIAQTFHNIMESRPERTDAGTYYVWLCVKQDNHWSEYKRLKVTIEKADPTCTAPEAVEGLVYSGQGQQLITKGESEDGTMKYRLAGEKDFITAIPTASDAGSYTVEWNLAGDDNHKDAAGELTAGIGRAEASVSWKGQSSFEYDGKSHGVDASDVTINGVKAGDAGDVTVSLSGDVSKISIGSYAAKVGLAGDAAGNYEIKDGTDTLNWSITEPTPVDPGEDAKKAEEEARKAEEEARRAEEEARKAREDADAAAAAARSSAEAAEYTYWLGTYSGEIPKAKSVKVKTAGKSFTVTWKKLSKKQRKKFTKVEIQYCTDGRFDKNTTVVKERSKNKTSLKVKGLTKGSVYYVRVRNIKYAYDKKYVSTWSPVKKVTVK